MLIKTLCIEKGFEALNEDVLYNKPSGVMLTLVRDNHLFDFEYEDAEQWNAFLQYLRQCNIAFEVLKRTPFFYSSPLPCGCHYEHQGGINSGYFEFVLCAMHKAAPDMLEVLRRIKQYFYDKSIQGMKPNLTVVEAKISMTVDAVIAKATGEED